MARASWRGFLRLSLVSCPVWIAPATSEGSRVKLRMINAATGNPIAMKVVDSVTGEEVPREDVAKGYERDRGSFVVLTEEDLAGLKVESTRAIELESFVELGAVDPLYLEASYHVHADGPIAAAAFRTVRDAMEAAGVAGFGSITVGGRERRVTLEPCADGMMMWTIRNPDEVREPKFEDLGEPDREAVAVAAAIIRNRTGSFDPANFRDRYQDALRALIEAKVRGEPAAVRAASEPPSTPNLMDALRLSLGAQPAVAAAPRRARRR